MDTTPSAGRQAGKNGPRWCSRLAFCARAQQADQKATQRHDHQQLENDDHQASCGFRPNTMAVELQKTIKARMPRATQSQASLIGPLCAISAILKR